MGGFFHHRFSSRVVNGTVDDSDAVALQAQSDLTTAYNFTVAQPCGTGNSLTGQNLGGLTLTPGVYCFASSAQLTGTVTFDASGQPECGLSYSDRKHADDRKRLICCVHRWRSRQRSLLASRELGCYWHYHCFRGKYSRTHEHHSEYRRKYSVRQRLGDKRCGDHGYESSLYASTQGPPVPQSRVRLAVEHWPPPRLGRSVEIMEVGDVSYIQRPARDCAIPL